MRHVVTALQRQVLRPFHCQSGRYATLDLAADRDDRGLKAHGYRDWSLRDSLDLAEDDE